MRLNLSIINKGLWVLLLTMLLYPNQTIASEESVRLTQEGILLLEEGKTEAAREKLKDALKADLKDEDARYYLAHAYVISGMYSSALKILGDKDMQNWDAAYLRGIAHLNLNQPAEAMAAFEASIKRKDNARARFNLGMLNYQNGDYTKAKTHLDAAKTGLDSDSEAYRLLYLGLIAAQAKDEATARQYFEKIKSTYSNSAAAVLAEEMLGGTGKSPSGKDKHFFVDMRVIEQYDSNVALVQTDDTYAQIYHRDLTENATAFRTAGYLAMRGVFGGDSGFSGFVGLGGYSGLNLSNEKASDFNAWQAKLFGQLGHTAQSGWGLEFPFTAARTWLGDFDPYNITAGIDAIYFNELTKALVLRTGILFENQSYDADANRDGFDIGAMLEAVSPIKDNFNLRGGYTFSNFLTKTNSSIWSYMQHKIQLGSDYRPIDRLLLFGNFAFANRSFEEPFIDPIDGAADRSDNELTFGLGTRVGLGKRSDLTLSYDGFIQDSIPSFTYDRHIITLSLGVTF